MLFEAMRDARSGDPDIRTSAIVDLIRLSLTSGPIGERASMALTDRYGAVVVRDPD